MTGESLTHNLYHDPRSVVNASDLNDGLAPTALDDQGAGKVLGQLLAAQSRSCGRGYRYGAPYLDHCGAPTGTGVEPICLNCS